MEIIDSNFYVIGDDSKWLYCYTIDGKLIEKHLLFSTSHSERIPKKEKPDLETLTSLTLDGITFLLTLGSGSKKNLRNKGFLFNTITNEVIALDLTSVYSSLRSRVEVVGEKKLNIEGLATTEDELVLFTRGNVSGKNVMLSYNLKNFIRHLIENEQLKDPWISSFNLPPIDNWLSGFSGATYSNLHKSFLFTSTVEVTSNEIDDGKCLGSFIGLIENNDAKRLAGTCIIEESQGLYLGKVESISILNETKTSIIAMAVTDSDGGESELLEIEILL